MTVPPALTVYHDGSCPLCRLEIGHYRRQRGAERIEFVDVADPNADPGPGLSRQQALKRFHARLPGGELKSGAAAFIEIWKLLPRWRPAESLGCQASPEPCRSDTGFSHLYGRFWRRR